MTKRRQRAPLNRGLRLAMKRSAILALIAVATAQMVVGADRGAPTLYSTSSIAEKIDRAVAQVEQSAPLPTPLLNLADLAGDVWNTHFRCYASYYDTRVRLCPLGDTRARRTVVVVGDSHMGQWLAALDRIGQRRGFRVLPLVKLSCAPFDVYLAIKETGGEFSQCSLFRRWAFDKIRQIQPKVVVLSARVLAAGITGSTLAERATDWRQGSERSVRRLRSFGVRHVKVLSDTVQADRDPGTCLRQRDADMATCVWSPTRRVRLGNRVVRLGTEAGGGEYVDVLPLICRARVCPAVVDRVVTMRDDDHLSVTWVRAVARALARRLELR